MPHARELLMDELQRRLEALVAKPELVFLDRVYAIQSDQMPALALEPDSETSETQSLGTSPLSRLEERTLVVKITAFARSWKEVHDLALAVEKAVMEAPLPGETSQRLARTDFDTSGEDRRLYAAQPRYEIDYQVLSDDPSALV